MILPEFSGVLSGFSGIQPRFSRILPKLSEILHGFLTNKTFGGVLEPPALPPPTPLLMAAPVHPRLAFVFSRPVAP